MLYAHLFLLFVLSLTSTNRYCCAATAPVPSRMSEKKKSIPNMSRSPKYPKTSKSPKTSKRSPKPTKSTKMSAPSLAPSTTPSVPPTVAAAPSMMPSSTPSAPPSRQEIPLVDVIFQIDESESMGVYHSNVEKNVAFMFSQLAAATGGNFRVGLVGYGGYNSVPRRLSALTNDNTSFMAALKQLETNGLVEPGYDAIYETATESLPEGALGIHGPFCAILIGNEGPNGGTKSQADAIDAMYIAKGTQFVVVADPATSVYAAVATTTGGNSYDIANFSTESEAQLVLNDVLAKCTLPASPSMMPSSMPSTKPTSPSKYTDVPSMMPSSTPSAPPSRQEIPPVDIIFQIDESESMGVYHSNVEKNVAFMFRQVAEATGGNFQVGLVGYGGYNSVPRRLISLTNDNTSFMAALKQLETNGLIEPGYDAIYETATETLPEGTLGFHGPFCAILIGNEGPNGGTRSQADAIDAMYSAKGTQFVIVADPTTSDYAAVATATGGKSYDIKNFSTKREAQLVLNDVLAKCMLPAHPSMMPSSMPSASPSKIPIPPPSPICEPKHTFKIVLSTDSYGEELSWNLYRLLPKRSSLFSSEALQGNRKKLIRSKSAGDYSSNMNYRETYKLGKGQYQFQIIDSVGNGPSSYKIILDGQVLRKGGKFIHSESTFFTVGPKVRADAIAIAIQIKIDLN